MRKKIKVALLGLLISMLTVNTINFLALKKGFYQIIQIDIIDKFCLYVGLPFGMIVTLYCTYYIFFKKEEQG